MVGSRKCATTWLYELFLLHDECCVSRTVKQSGFFTKYFDKGRDWYFNHFTGYTNNQIVGEIDADIITTSGSIERVHMVSPEAKIIAIFRNPADLFFSSYEHAFRKGDVNDPPEIAWEKYPQFYNELKFGSMIETIFKQFPPDQVLVVCYDDIDKSPLDTLRQIAKFLGIKSSFEVSLVDKRINPSRKARFPRLTKILSRVARSARRMGLHRLITRVKKLTKKTESITTREEVEVNRSGMLRTKILEAMTNEVKLYESITATKTTWLNENK